MTRRLFCSSFFASGDEQKQNSKKETKKKVENILNLPFIDMVKSICVRRLYICYPLDCLPIRCFNRGDICELDLAIQHWTDDMMTPEQSSLSILPTHYILWSFFFIYSRPLEISATWDTLRFLIILDQRCQDSILTLRVYSI